MPSRFDLKKLLPVLIYLAGMIPLGYFEHPIRVLLSDSLSFVAVIGYLISLRLLGMAAIRTIEWRERIAITRHNAAVAAKKEARAQSRMAKANET